MCFKYRHKPTVTKTKSKKLVIQQNFCGIVPTPSVKLMSKLSNVAHELLANMVMIIDSLFVITIK